LSELLLPLMSEFLARHLCEIRQHSKFSIFNFESKFVCPMTCNQE
jgi:hypothetical protein